MINVDELYSYMGKKRRSGAKMAKVCKVSPKTWYSWMSKRKIPSDKVELIMQDLDIKDPIPVFFDSLSRNA